MNENRTQQRFETDLSVSMVTVLEMKEGRIIDLSSGGAQIVGASFPQGTRFQIDFNDQTIYARVMWDEVDRMGVRFEYPISSGPLHDIMSKTRVALEAPPMRAYIGAATVRPQAGFGRRAA